MASPFILQAQAGERYSGKDGQLEIAVPRIDRPPKIDGLLEEAVWQQAPILCGFTQFMPIDGVPACEETEALVLYSRQAIYFGFICHYQDPSSIKATLTNRDEAFADDYVGICLDTYDDQRRAFMFIFNPLGVVGDGVRIEGGDEDYTPDFTVDSRGRLTDEGYVVEAAIPFKSLRFPGNGPMAWGLNVFRKTRSQSVRLSWAPIDRNQSNLLAQSGHLVGIRDVQHSRNVELNPVLTGAMTGQLDDADDLGSSFKRDSPKPELGLNLKYLLSTNLALDATINPDFSQVEADADVVDINERFAIYFSEKRPFFLEGKDIYQTPYEIFYSRRIVDPLSGAKISGKIGPASLGFLSAVDDDSLGNAAVQVARLKWDVMGDSHLGLLATDRRVGGHYNSVAGFDGMIRLRRYYTLSFQGLGSWSDDVEDGRRHDPAWYARLAHGSRHVDVYVSAADVFPDFRAQLGYIPRTDQVEICNFTQYHYFGSENGFIQSWDPGVFYRQIYDHSPTGWLDRKTDWVISPQFDLNLRGGWELGMSYDRLYTYYEETAFPDQTQIYLWGSTPRWQMAQFGWLSHFGDTAIYDQVVAGTYWYAEPWLDLYPTSRLKLNLWLWAQDVRRQRDGSFFARARIFRVRSAYQFSRELSFRFILEASRRKYYHEDGTLDQVSKNMVVDLLLKYQLDPVTIFYIGWGNVFGADLDHDYRRTREGVFAKASYLWRL
jgi:hypothetical protein